LGKGGDINGGTGRSKRENPFIENNITRDVYTPCGSIKALVAFVHRTVPKEDTHARAESKFVCIIFTKTRPASASKNLKKLIIGTNTK
jgi:hypothetical protein